MDARLSALVVTLSFALLPACKGGGDEGKAPAPASGASASAHAAAEGATAAGSANSPTTAPAATTTAAATANPPSTPGATAPTPSTGPFEGTIAVRITQGAKPPLDLTFQTKGNRVRLDLTGADGKPAHAVFDAASRKLVVLSDADKSMTTTTLSTDHGAATVTKTGVHETVLGRDCENWDVVEANGTHDAMCVTTGIPFVDFGSFLAPEAGVPSLGEWMKGVADAKTFPIRQVVVGTSGAIDARAQVRVIEAHPVDDGVFAIPAGYKPATAKH